MEPISSPFRGSDAIKQGLLTPKQLRGPNYHRLFPGIYLHRGSASDLRTRSIAAYLLVSETGALAGYSAAELLGARCAPRDADVEVLTPGRRLRQRPGMRVHRGFVADDEVTTVHGVLVTSPVRTAFDLARWLPLIDAVVAVDALARVCEFLPSEVDQIYRRYPRVRWRTRVGPVLGLTDERSESPMETRLRLVLVLRGLPQPEVQHWVEGPAGQRARLDLAYADLRIGIEYDGDQHRDRGEFAADRRRDNWLGQLGWLVLRFTADDVLRKPDSVAAQVRSVLFRRRSTG